jgi:hypothetical protein
MGYTKLNQNLVWFSEPKGAFTLVVIYFPTYKGPSLHMNQILTQVEVHPQLRRWNPALTQLRSFTAESSRNQLSWGSSTAESSWNQLSCGSSTADSWLSRHRQPMNGVLVGAASLFTLARFYEILAFPPITCVLLYTGPFWRPPHTITIIVN